MAYAVKRTVATEAQILAIGAAGTACPGGLYLSTDSEKLWLGANDGHLLGPYVTEANSGPSFFDAFKDDTDASQGGVPINGYYTLRNDNNYGLPGGLSKKRTE